MSEICIVTPGQLSANPRVVKEADALIEAGHSVSVICTRMVDWANETDAEFRDRGWRVAACISLGRHEALLPRLYRGARRRAADLAYRAGLSTRAVVEAAWHEVTPELARAARRTRADLYVAHYPAALPAAAQAAALHGSTYAYDAEDFHLGDPPGGSAFDRQRSLTRQIEARYLQDACYVTAASPGIADAYVEAYGVERPRVILNVFPLSEAPEVPASDGTARPGPSVFWFSQTIGEDRGLECAIAAIGRARSKPHLYLLGRTKAGYDGRLMALAAAHGASDRLHFLPPVAPSALARVAATFDVGLASETGRSRNRQVALTNKLFTYLLAGVPVLLSDIPAHRALVSELGDAAVLFGTEDPRSLAVAMDGVLLSAASRRALRRQQAWQLGQSQYNWDREKAYLLEQVDFALRPSSTRNPRVSAVAASSASRRPPAGVL